MEAKLLSVPKETIDSNTLKGLSIVVWSYFPSLKGMDHFPERHHIPKIVLKTMSTWIDQSQGKM